MSAILIFALLGSWVSFGGYDSAPEVSLLESDENHVLVQIDLTGYSLEEFSQYSRFSLKDYYWDIDAPPGSPALPLIPVVLGVPRGLEATVSLVDASWHLAGNGLPYPVQPLRTDSDVEPVHFFELQENLQGSYPLAVLDLNQEGIWAGANTVVLAVSPFVWNADTGEFKVAETITARVDFEGTQEFQPSVRPEIANMHQSSILNYESLNIPVDASPVSMDDNVYLCLIPPENLDAFTPFLAMINSLGHHVKIIEIESGATSYTIKNTMLESYQEGVTRFAVIAAKHQQIESKNYGSFVGDFYYELITPDNLPDIAVGRFPGNASTLPNQFAKTMSYITYEGVSGEPSLPASVVLAAHQEDYPGKYTANSNAVKDWDYELADIEFTTVYPPEGGTPDDVSDAINNGIGIVNYRGHGSVTTWQWTGSWNAGKIYALTNTHFPPVFNVCCDNGTHNLTYNCLTESWLDGPGSGASGALGASAPSATTVNHRMQRVLFWELFDEGNTCAGEMFAAVQTDAIQYFSAGGLNNAKMYHWFGDPSMDIPNSDVSGAPFPLDFDVPAAINTGSNTLYFTVTSGGSPVEGVVVTVTDGIGNHSSYTESFYEQQVTNASGEVWLNFTAIEGKDLYYGARLHNYASVTGTIDVTTSGIEGGEVGITELLPVSPAPVSGTAAIGFTLPVTGYVNVRIVDLAGRTVTTLLDGELEAGSNSFSFDSSTITPGIYFVVMQTSEVSLTQRMAVVR